MATSDCEITMDLSNSKNNIGSYFKDLPKPGSHALSVSRELTKKIRTEIKTERGHISFKRYMEMALYQPGMGYYSSGTRKFGKTGDFITAPELSPLFSRCLARQCEEIMNLLQESMILECGAGSGVMASDILQELERRDCLPEKYLILEPSADLKQRQYQFLSHRIPELLNKIEWLDKLPDSPFKGLILANEVLDALPVERVIISDDSCYALDVAWSDNAFIWKEVPADALLTEKMNHIQSRLQYDWPDGYTTEINTILPAWIASLSDLLEQGAMLFVDYGYPQHEYYHPQRLQGSLQCHYRHHVHYDPFLYPGLQDITASVDFTAVAEAAVSFGFDVIGYTTQAHFLLSCGLDEFMALDNGNDKKKSLEIARQVKLLTLPGEMGERFKVMALGKQFDHELLGFRMADHRSKL